MVDNSINPQSEEDIRREKEAVAMLLAQAQAQMVVEEAVPTAPQPVGDIDDLNDLHRQKAEIEQKLKVTESREAELREQLKRVLETKADLNVRLESLKVKASKLFESIFGEPKRPASQVEQPESTPRAAGPVAPLRKPDNSIVFDKTAPTTAMPQGAPAEVNAVQKLGGFSF